MQVIVCTDNYSKEEFLIKKISPKIQITFIENFEQLFNYTSADVFFILKDKIDKEYLKDFTAKPVFINSTITTLKELEAPENFTRFNGWQTFLKREIWEVATANENIINPIFEEMGWEYKLVKDTPGLVSARIVAMIINEAYFALGDEVSSKNEIDLAMKLGTNYPYGPFEWCDKIGIKNIYSLLKKLSEEDVRYHVAPSLEIEFQGLK